MPLNTIAERAKKYRFKVYIAYIAEVKRSLGLTMYDAPNVVGELKQSRKHLPKEKAPHFQYKVLNAIKRSICYEFGRVIRKEIFLKI